MRCDEAAAGISMQLDGALEPRLVEDVEEHVAGCASCRAFRVSSLRVRQHLRYEVVEDVPDVEAALLAAVRQKPARAGAPQPGRRRVSWIAAAAALLAGIVAGATFMGVRGEERDVAAAADLSDRVLAVQQRIDALRADIVITEHGWHPDVPVRQFRGELEYRAPESLAITLRDLTAYPSKRWRPNDVSIVVDRDHAWRLGPAACPRESLPSCTPAQPRILENTIAREPFPDATPAPLDLVVPVGSFAGGGGSASLGAARLDGKEALGVEVTVAQAAPLLDGILATGNWRELHSTDRVRLWLERSSLVPLRIEIRPATSPEREAWAARRGYVDNPDTHLLDVRLHDVGTIGAAAPAPSPAPAGALERSQGFRELPAEEVAAPTPARLPDGLVPYRAGVVETPSGPPVAVRTWTDGRAWLKVRATDAWPGGRLFGDVGRPVRVVALGAAGVAYVGDGGRRIGLHGTGTDVVVTGSIGERELLQAAASLGVRGEAVPENWAEAGAASSAEAAAALPGVLVPRRLTGFSEPAIRIDGDVVTFALAGPGARGFELVAAPGEVLGPALDLDARGVEVRGTAGRFSPARGELEWVERGNTFSLRSDSLSLGELLRIAGRLRPA